MSTNRQTELITISNNCCLALCYMVAANNGVIPSLDESLRFLSDGVKRHCIAEDGYVLDGLAACKILNRRIKAVIKRQIAFCAGEYVCVCYKEGFKNHWTLWKRNKNGEYEFYWNPLCFSNCVENGKPNFEDCRDIII